MWKCDEGKKGPGQKDTKPNQTRDRGGNGINDFYYGASANGQCGQSLTELNSLNTGALHKAKVGWTRNIFLCC